MADLKEHMQRAKHDPSTSNIEALWRAVFRLPAWYFLPAGEEAGPDTPLVTEIDGEAWLLAFWNFRRINEFARATGRRDDHGEFLMLTLSPDEAVSKIEEVAHHIRGVVFNIGSEESFRAPVEAIMEFVRRFDGVRGE